MALTDLQRVRYKTSLDTALLPDEIITDFIDEHTDPVSDEWDFENTLADVFDYLAAKTGNSQGVSSFTRGPTTVMLKQSYLDRAAYWRKEAGVIEGIVEETLERADFNSQDDDSPEYDTDTDTEF